MGTLLRILVIVTIALVAYELLMQYRRPKGECVGVGGRFAQIRQLLRKARQVALIYVVVIVVSGILRITGWIE